MSKSLSFIKRKNSCGSRRISALLLAMLAFVCTVVFSLLDKAPEKEVEELFDRALTMND